MPAAEMLLQRLRLHGTEEWLCTRCLALVCDLSMEDAQTATRALVDTHRLDATVATCRSCGRRLAVSRLR